jgi:hypothetical protein
VITRLLATVLCAATLWACNDTSTLDTPSPLTQLTVTGRWTGNLIFQDVTGRMTWTLTQNGTAVTGPVLISLPNGTVLLNGTLTGTLNGTSLPYIIAVAANGIPNRPTCTGQLGGTMTVSSGTVPTMTGSIAIMSANCSILFSGTNFTLTRQTGIGG